MVEHGSPTAYTYGCRCEACKAAKSAYARESRPRLLAKLLEPDTGPEISITVTVKVGTK